MEWNASGLFASPLIRITIDDFSQAKALFFSKIHCEESVKKQGYSKDISHYHSFENVFDCYPELAGLREKLEEAGTFAYRDLLNYKRSGPMRITNAWFNLCQPGGFQEKHSHANNLLSATLYLNTDQHTELQFYHPLSTDSLHPELYDEVDTSANEYGLRYHHREVTVAVNDGDCLFWPSQLRHGYRNNRTPNRLSLSFNLMPEKLNTTYQAG